jgi:glycosyltransferase involved in cell wall biosynthesis
VHVTSDIEAAELEKFDFRLRRVAMVPNGVDDVVTGVGTAVSDDIATLARGGPLILFLGRIAWVKGLDRLLRAFARTTSGTLAIVGTDYERLAGRLAGLAQELGVAHRFRLVPRTVTGADKEFAFASARAFVLPSHSESFGNAALEAMQRGVPAIVTPQVGAAEIVRCSGGGLVVDGDAEALGGAIERLATDPALAAALGAAGRRYVEAHYGWSGIAAQMEELYRDLAARRACATISPR